MDVVENVNANVKGGELEFTWAPARGANLQFGVSHLETHAIDIPLPAGGLTNAHMSQAPAWSVNASVRYEWSIPLGYLAVEADTKFDSGQYMELMNAPADYEAPHAISNARVTFSSGESRWEVTGWVRNLTDRRYRVYGLDLSSLGLEQGVYGSPRTGGVTFTYRWGP